ncbi:MAG: hypothetical protein GY711_08230 [bacterium]|nr:hypothetical protein [bacterium]
MAQHDEQPEVVLERIPLDTRLQKTVVQCEALPRPVDPDVGIDEARSEDPALLEIVGVGSTDQRTLTRAAEVVPDSTEVRFWTAFTIASAGDVRAAAPIFQSVFDENDNWIELLQRLPAAGLGTDDLVEKILSATSKR